ncbi:MAG: DegV family protein [Clostridiaceae bacterium]
MDKIKIITDSTADLSEEIIKKYDIEVLPLLVTINGETYRDIEEIQFEELMSKIEEHKQLPTTTQVNPQSFCDAYEKYLNEGYKVISIHISSNLSGTYQSASIAKGMLNSDDIFVIDSLNVTSGLGLLVIKACKLKEQGKSAEEIYNEISALREHVKCAIVFSSLDNLIKGGRISRAAGIIGSALGIKLILEIKDGKLDVVDKVRGSKKTIKNVINFFDEANIKSGEDIMLLEAGTSEMLPIIKEELAERKVDYIFSKVGCVVGTHSGNDAFGIFFIENF